MSKVLVLTGSPRVKGNSYILAEDFIRGAEEAGHEVQRIDMAKKTVGMCSACDQCFSQGHPCTAKNDANEVLEAVMASDAIVMITPIYWYTFPAQLKGLIDKFYAYMVGDCKEALGKKTALVVVGGDATDEAAKGMLYSYEKTCELLQWDLVKSLTYFAYNDAGSIKGAAAEEEVYQLGKNWA